MQQDLILMLEDDEDRIRRFEDAVKTIGGSLRIRIWRDAGLMITGCDQLLSSALLISLDHDLNSVTGADPGTGLDVAEFLASRQPTCPVVIHSSNVEKSWSMHNELRFAGWTVERVGPLGDDWIMTTWISTVTRLLGLAKTR
ncbi:MAG: hypothetical protein HY301_03545 [Verrucomicrobia bacterium]|nr:hypothetical protein [Verrucomicrobiota bacterium]